ncbi:MAG: sugar phosphate isomerase/epimerase [Bacteroidales bacterium]|nr:sugar phosphate isomerase/epimerase [Bacteroidales bacterium]
MRPVTLCTLQWTDLDIEEVCRKAKEFGYDGLELACCGNHIEVNKADDAYCKARKDLLEKYGLKLFAVATHLVSQCVCDIIDERHKSIVPAYIWGDGSPEGVRQRAARDVIDTARVAKRLGINVVNGFTGSSIWHLIYSFPPVPESMIEKGYEDFGRRWIPILDEYQKLGIRYALEVHPTEIAFDIATAERALKAVHYHPAFGFNFDPSHLGYQGIDYLEFIYRFADRIFHVHMKDVGWYGGSGEAGVFGGYIPFGDRRRYWNFRSLGHGNIDFGEIIRALNHINYSGALSVEWEDSGMDREHGAREACEFVKNVDFTPSKTAFDSVFEKK